MKRDMFFDADGRLRMGLAAPAAIALYFAAQYIAAAGFGLISGALLKAWGVTAKSLPYAPHWLQTALAGIGSLESVVQGLAGLLAVWFCARFLRKRRLGLRAGHIGTGAGIGFALAAAAFVLLRTTDSVRCMAADRLYPLAELFAALGALGAALAPEALLGGFFAPEMRGRPWVRALTFMVLNALMYVLGAAWSVPAIACALAMSAACAVLYERLSFAAAAAMRGFFGVFAHRLFGFSAVGAPGMFFETYPVSRDWLTGGDAGLEAGWLCAALFAACAALAWKTMKKKKAEETEK